MPDGYPFPERGWFFRYLTALDDTEPLPEVLFWAAAVAFGAAFQKRVWLDLGFKKVYPSMYMLLVGSSGSRKTTAADYGVKILREAQTTKVIRGSLSPQALIKMLASRQNADGSEEQAPASALIYAPELATFMGLEGGKDQAVRFISLLTDLADEDPEITRDTLKWGKQVLRNVCLSFLGCVAPEWVPEILPRVAVGGGFLARTLTIRCEGFRVSLIPKIEGMSELVEQLKLRVEAAQGEARLTDIAVEWFKDWYNRYRREEVEEIYLQAYRARRHVHLARLALVLSLAKDDDFMTIDEAELIQADLLLTRAEAGMEQVVRDIDTTPSGQARAKVLAFLLACGGQAPRSMTYSAVAHRLAAWEFNAVLAGLVEEELVTLSIEKTGGGLGRPTAMIFLTNKGMDTAGRMAGSLAKAETPAARAALSKLAKQRAATSRQRSVGKAAQEALKAVPREPREEAPGTELGERPPSSEDDPDPE